MSDILKTCYRVIKTLDIPTKDRENLFRELAEGGFTKSLKEKLIRFIEGDLTVSKQKLFDRVNKASINK